MRLNTLILLLSILLLSACSTRRSGSGGRGGDDDDSVGSDDDDATADDDDATANDDDDATANDDDDATANDDDDDTFADDDDTFADDDDTSAGPSTVEGAIIVSYFSDAAGQDLVCQQFYNFSADATWGPNPSGASCPGCTGYLHNVSTSPDTTQTTCTSGQLGDADLGTPLTTSSLGGDFAQEMAVVDINTALATGLALTDSNSPDLQSIVNDSMNNGNQITHLLMIDQRPGNFFTDALPLDSNGAATMPGTDWMFFWLAISQGGSPAQQMSGSYFAVSQWNLTGLGMGPTGPEQAQFGMLLTATP